MHQTTWRLAAPSACPALLDSLAIALARLTPATPLAPTLLAIDRVVFSLAIGWFAWWLVSRTERPVAALACGLGLAALPMLDVAMAPFPSLPILATVVVAWSLTPLGGALGSGHLVILAVSAVVLVASVPALAVPIAVIVGGGLAAGALSPLRQSGGRWAGLAIAALAMISALLSLRFAGSLGTAPLALRACLAWPPSFALGHSLRSLAAVATAAGPYVSALAALGLFTYRASWRSVEAKRLAWMGSLSLVGSVITDAPSAALAAPMLVAFWATAALGLSAMMAACGTGAVRQAGALGFAALVPLLVASTRMPVSPAESARGHERLSLDRVRALRDAVPAGSRLVEEDAITDVLIRASSPRDPSSALKVISGDRTTVAIETRAPARPVFALPAAQDRLQLQGFKLAAFDRFAGLARLDDGGDCQVLGTAWRELRAVTRSTAFALVARDESEAGPFVAYATLDRPPTIGAVHWPRPSLRGFYVTSYSLSSADREQFARDMNDDGLPAEDRPPADALVVRLELWRIPGAPLSLAVDLGTTPTRAVGHLIPPENPKHLTVCPAYPSAVRSIE